MKKKASNDVNVLSAGTQQLGSTTSGENVSRFCELSRVLRLDLRRLFCKASGLPLDRRLYGSRSDKVYRQNKSQQQLNGVVVQVLTYARHAFSETGTTQRVK